MALTGYMPPRRRVRDNLAGVSRPHAYPCVSSTAFVTDNYVNHTYKRGRETPSRGILVLLEAAAAHGRRRRTRLRGVADLLGYQDLEMVVKCCRHRIGGVVKSHVVVLGTLAGNRLPL